MEEEPKTAGEILRRCLLKWPLQSNCVIPNCYLAGWEADLLVIRPSGWITEVEIKVSVSDFRNEWKTKGEKHAGLREGPLLCVGRGRNRRWKPLGKQTAALGLTHDAIAADPTLHEREGYWFIRRPGLIRHFWFALPESMAEKLLAEIPEPYGVLGIGPRFNLELRKPKVLPCRKITDAERIQALQSTYWRFWRQRLRDEAQLELLSESSTV